jgi:predicted nucleotidyltransferase
LQILGIIAEFNPFHNGHLIFCNASRQAVGADYTVAVMSGCFVQRGEPAVCDKPARVEMALHAGVDLVIELPVYYTAASAEHFAGAAVRLLDSLGVVTRLSFGTESGDLETLLAISRASLQLDSRENFSDILRGFLSQGLPYARAREQTLRTILRIEPDFIRQPNHILALEYLNALERLNSPIVPCAVRRVGPGHHDPSLGAIASATALRQAIARGDTAALQKAMPESAFDLLAAALARSGPAWMNNFSQLFQYLIKTKEESDLSEILDMNEGLENRMIRFAGQYEMLEDILAAVKTKRYPLTKLRRAALHLLLNIRGDDFDRFNRLGGPQYIRVLGFRKETAGPLLRAIKRKARLPLVMNLKRAEAALSEDARRMLRKEIQATDIYYLACAHKKDTLEKNQEYRVPLVMI